MCLHAAFWLWNQLLESAANRFQQKMPDLKLYQVWHPAAERCIERSKAANTPYGVTPAFYGFSHGLFS